VDSIICLEEDVSLHFELDQKSPWMLYFAKVKNHRLDAVMHVDGSARPQTVTIGSNPLLYQLLVKFKKLTNDGVLCNTSLNFNGTGFINRSSDLVRYSTEAGLDGFIVEGIAYIRRGWGKESFNE
jgi:hydroxymethyl cephem carbamoyltransferase